MEFGNEHDTTDKQTLAYREFVTGRNGEVGDFPEVRDSDKCLVAGMSRACHGRHREVGTMEFEL